MKKTKKTKKKDLSAIKKIDFGIEGFDVISEGGIPKGRTTLLSGTSGSGKTLFATEFLWQGYKKHNESGVFVTFEETPRDIIRNVKSLGWDLNGLIKKNKLAFVDASPSPYEKTEVGEYDFGALIARILYAIKKVKAKRVVVDSITALFPQYKDTGIIRRELFRITAALKKQGVTAVISSERLEEYGSIARFGVEEFVSDNVIVIRNVLDEERRRRTVEILKFRGTMHQKGEYPFTISSDGIKILPLSGMELIMKSSTKRISSGNKDIDRMTGGGFFRDSIILVSGPTGTGKTLMTTLFADGGCSRGEKCLLFAYEESKEQLVRNGTSWGVNLEKWIKKGLLKIVCRYPESMGPEDHLISIKKEMDEFKPNRLVIDSLSAMERVLTLRSFREFVISLSSYTKLKEIAGMFTSTTKTLLGGESITEAHISTLTDAIIILRYVEMHGEMRRGLTVIKLRGSWHEKEIREYSIDNDGMHVSEPFRGVESIMTGAARSVTQYEEEELSKLMK
ncbi:MAG: circadian clock protein KaiC [Candidatus Omnitrophica bacterium]|nr:circadian clock protein KaiC [Candidatus Omnitrophota bacterium]MBU1851661.1 circadian clock protein KaiC [Candidatus Omnitrophota bacterium]